MPIVLTLVSLLSSSLLVADIGPNETQVILAAIAAVSSLVNFAVLRRDRQERNQHQAQVRQAISEHGLVAMVPESVVRDVEAAKATPPPPAPPAG